MRRIRLHIRLRRPRSFIGSSGKESLGEDQVPSRDFPPVPDGVTVPGPDAQPGELPARESPPRHVSRAINTPGDASFEKHAARRGRRPDMLYQPVLPSLGEQLVEKPLADGKTTPPKAMDVVQVVETVTDIQGAAPAMAESASETSPLPAVEGAEGAVAGAGELCCPGCQAALETRPHMETVCRGCGEAIHVRNGQSLFAAGLVPASEIDAVDLLERLEPLGITQEVCRQRIQRDDDGRPRRGALAALLREVCEERLPQLRPVTQARLLQEMARERQWRNEDPRPLLRRAQVVLLQQMRDEGVEKVRIACSGSGACPSCRELAGRSVAIADALAQQVLPHADCRHPDGLCRCRYATADGAPGINSDGKSR